MLPAFSQNLGNPYPLPLPQFGEYPTFEAFYSEVTHFQKNYSEVYPAEHQLRQEIDEIMVVFLRELKTIYRSHTQGPVVPAMAKKPKSD